MTTGGIHTTRGVVHSRSPAWHVGFAILAEPKAKADHHAGMPEPKQSGHWLISTLWHCRRYYGSAALATVLTS